MKLHNHFSSFDANTQIRWDSQNFIIIILIKHVMYYQLYKISLQSISIYYIFSSVLKYEFAQQSKLIKLMTFILNITFVW